MINGLDIYYSKDIGQGLNQLVIKNSKWIKTCW